ncbi:circadian clock KaiB family protein, partial [Acinetobacter baumannii]
TAAVISVRSLCERHLHGRYDLEIIDLYQQPERARTDQIVALPTLLREAPLPLLRLVGDMTDERRVLQALGLPVQ